MTTELIAFTREELADMMKKLERVTLQTSDEPQSLAQTVYMALRERCDPFSTPDKSLCIADEALQPGDVVSIAGNRARKAQRGTK